MDDRPIDARLAAHGITAGDLAGKGIGQPIERGGVTVLPVMNPRGRVMGVYVITDSGVRWEAALNVTLVSVMGITFVTSLVAFAWWLAWTRRKDAIARNLRR